MESAATGSCGLYLHVPFCTTKCGYCDFYSIPAEGRDAGGLVSRLLDELARRMADPPAPITTIFVGGGTPTVLPHAELARLLEPLARIAGVREAGATRKGKAGAIHPGAVREFTVEANPGTLDDEKAGLLVAAGVDRLSLGAQSFDPAELTVLERLHSPDDIAPAVRIARRAGIRRLNLDLIFGVPGQTLAGWLESLDRAIELDPDHLALYGLTYEPGTTLTRRRDAGRVQPCDDGLEAEMYLAAFDVTAAAGFEQYEISNFARPNQRCLHNLIYWHNEPYVGVGPSAAGYVGGLRYRNVPDLHRYQQMIDQLGHAVIERERIEGRQLAAETAMLQLRLIDGIDRAEFEQRTGFDPHQVFARSIARYELRGLLSVSPARMALTRNGLLVADAIIADFMADLDETHEVHLPFKPPTAPADARVSLTERILAT